MDANLLIAAAREPKYCSNLVTDHLRQLIPWYQWSYMVAALFRGKLPRNYSRFAAVAASVRVNTISMLILWVSIPTLLTYDHFRISLKHHSHVISKELRFRGRVIWLVLSQPE